MKSLHTISFVLLVVGGLNWLLSVFGWDLATWVGAPWWATVTKVVYVLVGLAAICEIFSHRSTCKSCEATPSQTV